MLHLWLMLNESTPPPRGLLAIITPHKSQLGSLRPLPDQFPMSMSFNLNTLLINKIINYVKVINQPIIKLLNILQSEIFRPPPPSTPCKLNFLTLGVMSRNMDCNASFSWLICQFSLVKIFMLAMLKRGLRDDFL